MICKPILIINRSSFFTSISLSVALGFSILAGNHALVRFIYENNDVRPVYIDLILAHLVRAISTFLLLEH